MVYYLLTYKHFVTTSCHSYLNFQGGFHEIEIDISKTGFLLYLQEMPQRILIFWWVHSGSVLHLGRLCHNHYQTGLKGGPPNCTTNCGLRDLTAQISRPQTSPLFLLSVVKSTVGTVLVFHSVLDIQEYKIDVTVSSRCKQRMTSIPIPVFLCRFRLL